MSIRKYKPEQIVTVLRQIEVQIANRKTAPQACKEVGIHAQLRDECLNWAIADQPTSCSSCQKGGTQICGIWVPN